MFYAHSAILVAAIALNVAAHPVTLYKSNELGARNFVSDVTGGFVGDLFKEGAELAVEETSKGLSKLGSRSFDNDVTGKLAGYVPEEDSKLALRWIQEYIKREIQGAPHDVPAIDLEQN